MIAYCSKVNLVSLGLIFHSICTNLDITYVISPTAVWNSIRVRFDDVRIIMRNYDKGFLITFGTLRQNFLNSLL